MKFEKKKKGGGLEKGKKTKKNERSAGGLGLGDFSANCQQGTLSHYIVNIHFQ